MNCPSLNMKTVALTGAVVLILALTTIIVKLSVDNDTLATASTDYRTDIEEVKTSLKLEDSVLALMREHQAGNISDDEFLKEMRQAELQQSKLGK